MSHIIRRDFIEQAKIQRPLNATVVWFPEDVLVQGLIKVLNGGK